MRKTFIFCTLALSLGACAQVRGYKAGRAETKARKENERIVYSAIIEGVRNNEACPSICLKLKKLLAIKLEEK